MRPTFKLIPLVIALFVSACGSIPKYQRVMENGVHRVGYTDVKLTPTSYRVKYLGNDSHNAYVGFMQRASVLTSENGFKFFVTKDVGALKENGAQVYVGAGLTQEGMSHV